MLSASTASSASPGAFSPRPSAGITPTSQYSGSPRKQITNPLIELIESEKVYLETLKIIDAQIAPIWMKQTVTTAPDFSELLRCVHDIWNANKGFCGKLIKIAANPQSLLELGDILMQWVDDMEKPYANYFNHFINNLNQRRDILSNSSMNHLLNNLSASTPYTYTLDSLFGAPLQQVKYYKVLYNRLLESTIVGQPDHKILSNANHRLDTVLRMAQNATTGISVAAKVEGFVNPLNSKMHPNKFLPQINTGFQTPQARTEKELPKDVKATGLALFEQQVDCSSVVDLFGDGPIPQPYRLRFSSPDATIMLHENFTLIVDQQENVSVRVHLLLTAEVLVICKVLKNGRYSLMYPPLFVSDITAKSISLDRELMGEYLLQLTVMGRKTLTMRADTREIRNVWVGVDGSAPSSTTLTPRPLKKTVQRLLESPDCPVPFELNPPATAPLNNSASAPIRKEDLFSFSNDHGGMISPLEESDDEEEDEPVKSKKPFARDTIMDLYDGHLNNFDIDTAPPPVPEKFTQPANKDTKHELPEDNLDTLQPRSIEILPHIPTEPASRTVTNNNLLPSLPRDAKPPAVPPKETLEAQVQMTYIQPATAQMTTMVTTKAGPSETVDRRKDPPTPAAVMNKPIAHQPSSESLRQRSPVTPDSGVPRPVSPRPAEVHHAPVPVAMSAVIQNNEYLNPHPPNQAPNLMDKSIKMDNAAPASTQAQGGNRTSPAIDPLSKSPLQRSMVDPPPSSSAQMPINHQVQHGRPPAPVMQSSLSSSTERLPPNSSPRLPPQQPVYPPQPHSPRPLGHRQPVNPPVANELGRHYYPPAAHPPRMISPPPRQGSSPLMAPPRVPMGSPSLGQPMHPVGVPRPAPSPVPNGYAMQAPSPVMRPSDRAPSPRPPNSVALENDQANAVRRVLFSHNQCEVFHWKDQSWYAVEGHCLLEVRQAFSNRTSVTVQLQNVGQMYLNAWILPTTVIRRPSQTDVSISVFMGPKKENYLVHFYNPNDCTAFANLLQRLHQNAVQMAAAAPPPPQSVRPESLMPEREELDIESLPQSLKPVMQCKCKLFSQNETSKWTNFGSVAMRISQQLPSKKMHIYIENDKNRLVSAIVRSSNVEKINNKRLSFLLVNEQDRTSMVYMIHMRDEETSNKIYHYLRTVNQSNGW